MADTAVSVLKRTCEGMADTAGSVLKTKRVSERLSAFSAQEEQRPVMIALCGLGRAGSFHLQSIRLLGPRVVKLAYVVDINADRCKEVATEYDCDWATDLAELLSSSTIEAKIDAVIVASTTDTHYRLCKLALEAKKALFTEKPISHNPAEVKDIIELAKSQRRPFIVGYQRRCDKNFRSLKKMIDAGDIGEKGPRMIRCTSRDNPLPPLEYLKTSGGIFHDMLSHDFDMLHFLSNGQIPEEVYSIGHCYEPAIAAMDDVDTVIVTLKFASGLLATVDTSRIAAYGYDQRVEAFGEKGMLTTHNEQESTVELANDKGHLMPVSQWSFPQRYKHTYTVELAEFVLMLRNQPEPLVEEDAQIERHVELEKVATAAELSWRIGKAVKISELGQLRHLLPH